ncbi:hypothetical protein [Actinomadura sp. WMMB 499]|uniref:TY-Chap domain-containing protein n=1 Tax=Actinomadura sp. WMMB 499 TaxID=1219491 RepID=UPI001246E7E3|nr:hypothetical protein [Actinomadura sp. WMMB 499]QFG22654.1 hypothetical protein F7P10_17550 [Actinomadura sp. WMMB 499]
MNPETDAPHGPGWAAFTDNLAALLADLAPNAKLIISATGNRYVQFAARHDELHGEVSGNAFLDASCGMTDADLGALAAAGWAQTDPDNPNWGRDVGRDEREVRLLAERAVEALRSPLRVESPSDLSVDGWVDGSGIDGDPGVDVARLGIGPGLISEFNARVIVHWYLRDQEIPVEAADLVACRLSTGWRFSAPEGGAGLGLGEPLDLYVSDDHVLESQPLEIAGSDFEEAFEDRYRQRNPSA